MNKGLIFLCLACGLLALSIVTICNAPIITHTIDVNWGTLNCKSLYDEYKDTEDDNSLSKDVKDEQLESINKQKHLCDREKAMYGLEYAAFILDLVFGFSCTLLSLLHYFGVGKYFEKITGIIGLISGAIGFIMTLIYIIYSGYIFTNDKYEDEIPKLDKNREIAKWSDSKYECLFYDEKDEDSFYAKWNDLGKKQYNYHKDFSFPDDNSKYEDCNYKAIMNNNPNSQNTPSYPYTPSFSYYDIKDLCSNNFNGLTKAVADNCDYLFYGGGDLDEISNKYQYDKWVATIIFGCIIILLNLGLAVFGFLMFKESGSSSGPVTIQ